MYHVTKFLFIYLSFKPGFHMMATIAEKKKFSDRSDHMETGLYFSLLLSCPFPSKPVYKFGFRRFRSPGGGKTRGSGTEKRCSHKWFHMSFSCTEPCTDTFCTLSALPLKNPQGVANLKKAICVVRSDSTMGVTL